MMEKISRFDRLPLISSILLSLLLTVNGETMQVRDALVQFMEKLSPRKSENWGWNMTSDPCQHAWKGVTCNLNTKTVKKIVLEGLNLTGELDAAALCMAKTLRVLSLSSNAVVGSLSEKISNCGRLTHLYLHGNRLSGSLPGSLSRLKSLRRIDVSDNGFSGNIPDFSEVPDLLTFLAENNELSGGIPGFRFAGLNEFNVSYNDLTGSIPDVSGRFNESSFAGNRGLCGTPLPNACPHSTPRKSRKDYFMYLGYMLIGLVVIALIVFKLVISCKKKPQSLQEKVSNVSSESKVNMSEFSITSGESGRNSSLMVLQSNLELRFEELLQSPAELLGRNRHGTLYKVTIHDSLNLVVKRTRDWDIARDDLIKRMREIDQVRHPNVLPTIAFYCSQLEKLFVYKFQPKGNLFQRIQGSQDHEFFDWGSRLNVAAKASVALAFMHEGLHADGIAHGNVKSSNILFDDKMEPQVSEYGLRPSQSHGGFTMDVHGFGVMLLELLTGKVVQNSASELMRWVDGTIREEWTTEVFDRAVVAAGASEEEMVGLLHVAMKCVNGIDEIRPTMKEVAQMISSIRESEEQSIYFGSDDC